MAAFAATVVLAVTVVLHSLDQPWLKRRVQALARASAGVDIDYRTVQVNLLSGLVLEGLVVRSPSELRAVAPDLVSVGRVQVGWSASSLSGRSGGAVLERIAVSDVVLTVVVDEHGRSSFDALSKPGTIPAPSAPVPLSRQASVLAKAPIVGEIAIDRVTLALVRTKEGQVSERSVLQGVSLAMVATPAPQGGGWRIEGGLGASSRPLDLDATRERRDAPPDTVRAKLWASVDATSSALNAVLDLRGVQQSVAPSVVVDEVLHAEAHVRFDATAGRTTVTLEHTQAGDRAATVEGTIEIPDAGDPLVRHAQGEIDLARLLRWVPAELVPVPVTAERAFARYAIDSLALGPTVHALEGGGGTLDADVANVVVGLAPGALHVAGGTLAVRARPAESGGIAGQGTIHLTGTQLDSGEDHLGVDDLTVDLEAQRGADGVVAGRVGIRFGRAERGGALPIVAREGHLELRAQGLHPETHDPLATRGDLAMSLELSSLDVTSPAARVLVDGLTLHAHTALDGHPPYALELDAPVTRLRLATRDARGLVDAPARIEIRARDVQPDPAHAASSRGIVHAALLLGDLQTSIDATKGADSVDFTIGVTTGSLRALRPLLPPALIGAAPWDRMAVAMKSSGRVEQLGAGKPTIRQTTEIEVQHPAFAGVAAQSLSMILRSQGSALAHQADVDLRARALAFGGGSAVDEHVTLSASVDREHPSVRFQVGTEGRATTKVTGSLSFDPSRRAVLYDVDATLAGLAPLAPFAAAVHGLDAVDLSQLEVSVAARGALLGVVTEVAGDGTVAFAPSPAQTAGIEGSADVRASHVRWARGDTAILTPALTWHGEMHATGARRTLDSRLEVGTLHLDLGSHDVDLNGIGDEAVATVIGDLADPELELTQHLSVRAVEQDLVPEYPLGAVDFSLSAERSLEGVVHLSDLEFANGLGGTTLTVSGNVDLGEGRRTLSLTTSVGQQLDLLSTIPERFKGKGKVVVDAGVTSPDLAHFRVRAVVKGQDVDVSLPRAGVDVATANGEVPITVALEVGAKGVALERSENRSPYSMLRFADQHPLLARSGFLSIARLKTPLVTIAPLVGNLEIDQNVVSLRQFEMGVRGGSITGQCGIDWDGPRSTLELHVRASGVQSSHGEPFDGNIAVVISAADRTVEGRAEILRIGERHLLDLLDLQDPLHVDPGINRIRTALYFGYPDSLRLVFDHGFASAHLELGGLARLVSIGDLRGMPMGPIVDKMLAPVLDGPHTKETP